VIYSTQHLINGLQAITAPHGSRYSVFVKLDKTPGDYTIRVTSSGLNQKVAGYATLSYGHGSYTNSIPYINYAGVNTTANVVYNNDNSIIPFQADPPAQHSDATHVLSIGRITNAWTWSLNGNNPYGEPLELEYPLLWAPTSSPNPNLTITTTNGSWVDIIIIIEPLQPSHPIHKHSNKGYLIVSAYRTRCSDDVNIL